MPGEPQLSRCEERTAQGRRYVLLRAAGQELLGVYRVLKRFSELKRLRRWPEELNQMEVKS